MSVLSVRSVDGGVRFAVHVQPRAAKTEITGLHGSALKVRLHAQPVDGAANEALVEFLAERFGVARAAVSIVAGHASRAKTVHVDGVSAAGVMALAEGAGAK